MAKQISDYFEAVSKEDYLTEAATKLPRSSLAMSPRPKWPAGRPEKTATANQLVIFSHSTSNRQRQPGSESELEKSSSPANQHTKEVHRQYVSSQKEGIVDYASHHGVRAASQNFSILRERTFNVGWERWTTRPLHSS